LVTFQKFPPSWRKRKKILEQIVFKFLTFASTYGVEKAFSKSFQPIFRSHRIFREQIMANYMRFTFQNLLAAAAAAILPCLTAPLSSFAATANVSVINFAFVPAATNIFAGDQVVWTWGSGFHSTTSSQTPPLWDSLPQNTPFVFSNTFTSGGTFPYLCTVHGFTGTINVAAANVPPTVVITNPAANAVFAAPASVTIRASAADSDGTVTNVQFLVGPTVLANQAAAPFSAVTNNLAAGGYTLSAIASDNLGATATNSITISVVTPVPLTISAIQQSPPANFQFNYAANAGLSYVVQRSTDLASTNWTTLLTNIAAGNPATFTDANATNNPGFYRVGRLPNP
jgi:plastocyanin